MDPETLRASLAPNLPPDAVSWWPPGPGWLVLLLILFGAGLAWLAWYSRRVPWWRWPRVHRQQQAYLAELNDLPDSNDFNRAFSQWLRRLMRDGLGVPPNLPPDAFVALVNRRSPTPLSKQLQLMLRSVYKPEALNPHFNTVKPELERLCLSCLHLHSPGPG